MLKQLNIIKMDEYFVDVMGKDKAKSLDILIEHGITINYAITRNYDGGGYVRKIIATATMPNDDDKDEVISVMEINTLDCLSFLNWYEVEDYADVVDQEFFDVCMTFLKSDYDEENEDGFIDITDSGDFIYIHNFIVEEKYQQKGFGKSIAMEIIDFIREGGDIIVVQPYPMKDKENPKAYERVKNFWCSIGFKNVNNQYYGYELDDYNIVAEQVHNIFDV